MRFREAAGAFLAAIVLSLPTLGESAQAEVRSNVHYVGYEVRGLTAADIWRDINRKGPHQRHRGLYAQAEAQIRYGWDAKYVRSRSSCRVQSAVVGLDVKIVLPSWVDQARGGAALRRAWSNYIAEVRRHEDHHKDIALATARELDRAISAAPAFRSCGELKRHIQAECDRILRREEAVQAHFDRTDRPIMLAGAH